MNHLVFADDVPARRVTLSGIRTNGLLPHSTPNSYFGPLPRATGARRRHRPAPRRIAPKTAGLTITDTTPV